MPTYAIWNNKGGVGKSYLTFQIAAEYAYQHPDKKILVIDLCPQANSSAMLLGGIEQGEQSLTNLHSQTPRKTIAGYIDDRISNNPYQNPRSGTIYLTQVSTINDKVADNLYLVAGDERLELLAPRVRSACVPGNQQAWQLVHIWVRDLIGDIVNYWNNSEITVFIDCNPSFSIYTELALTASDKLIIPFTADGSSKRAVRSVLELVYGVQRHAGQLMSEFHTETNRFGMKIPQIYLHVGNRLTQTSGRMSGKSATAFKMVVSEISNEIYDVWRNNPNHFYIRPTGAAPPSNQKKFQEMFQKEIRDANTASVVSSTLGIPICRMRAGRQMVLDKEVMINQSQLDEQVPNIRELVQAIE